MFIRKGYGYKLDTTVYNAVIDREVSTEVTPEYGNIVTHNIYYNEETDEYLDVTVDNVNKEVIIKVTNEPDNCTFLIEKVDYNDDTIKLRNAEFTLTSDIGHNITVKTDNRGKAYIYFDEEITNSTVVYTLEETNPPLGYDKITNIKFQVTYNKAGKMEKVSILEGGTRILDRIDTPSYLKLQIGDGEKPLPSDESTFYVRIFKTDINNKNVLLENVMFDITIESESGEYRKVIKKSDSSGRIYLNDIKGYGKIKISLTEIGTVKGYALDEETRTITILKESTGTRIVKDADGNEIEINDKYKDKISLVEDETSQDLLSGIEVFSRAQRVDVYITNKISDKYLGLNIVKEDSQDEELKLSKATFAIKDENSNEIQYAVSDKLGNAMLLIEKPSKPGTYTYKVQEMRAPGGYKEIAEVITVQVTYNLEGKI